MLGQILVTKQTGPQGKPVDKVLPALSIALITWRYLTYFCNCSSLFTFEFKMLVIVLVIKDTLLNHIHFSTPIFTYAGSVCMYARLRRDGLLYCNELYIWFVFDVFCLMKKVLCVEMPLF